MIRFAVTLALVFLVLTLIRAARILIANRRAGRSARPVEAEMVRDPVCGTWIDRRLAHSGIRGGVAVPVCSERCRRALEGR